MGPLPEAVGLPIGDAGTPSIGEGGGIVSASWDRDGVNGHRIDVRVPEASP